MLEMRSDEAMDIIMTGAALNDEVFVLADEVTKLETVKRNK